MNLTSKSEEFLQYIREVNTRLCVEYKDTGIIPMYVGEGWDDFNSEICPRPEVEFVHAVTASGSVKFLPAV